MDLDQIDNGPRPFTLTDAIVLAPVAIAAGLLIKLGVDSAIDGVRYIKSRKSDNK